MASQSPTNISKEHIVFCGPMGVGKTTIARALSIKTGLPVYSHDRLRNLPNKEAIQEGLYEARTKLLGIDEALLRTFNLEKFEKLKGDKLSAKNDVAFWEAQERLRNDPCIGKDFKSYDEMGYDVRVSCRLMDIAKENNIPKYVALHYYHKYFEIEMINQLATRVDRKAIIDLSGFAPVVLLEEYLAFEKVLKDMGPEGQLILDQMPMRAKEMPKALEEAMAHFDRSKIVSLHLADTYDQETIDGKQNPNYNDKAANSALNPFCGNQHDKFAGVVQDTTGMVQCNGEEVIINNEVAYEIAESIASKTAEKTYTI